MVEKYRGMMNDEDFNGVEGECVICMEEFDEENPRLRTHCACGENRVTTHRECIERWRESKNTCPLCRSLLFLEEDLRGALGIPEADTNADDSDTSDLPQSVPPPVPPDVEELEENLDEILFGAGRTGDSGRSSEEDTSSGSEGWTLEEGIESEEEG